FPARRSSDLEPGTVASNRWASGTYRTDTSGRARSSSFAGPLTSPPPGGVEQFGPSPRPSLLDGPAHRALRAGEGAVDCGPEVLVLLLDHDRRHPHHRDLDPAQLVDAAAGAVHVLEAHAHALDVGHELPQLAAQLATDRVPLDDAQYGPDGPDVGRHLERRRTRRLDLLRPRDPF